MTTRTRSILGWTPAVLTSLFLILASGVPKLFLSYEGSSLQEFATQLGLWDILLFVGILEIACAILLLIPRTSTIGFILMIGLLSGAMATGLTHTAPGNWPFFPLIFIALITLSAYFRNPELLSRAMKRDTPSVPKWLKIISWVLAIFIALMFAMSAVFKFVPAPPESVQAIMSARLGFTEIQFGLGILQFLILIPFLIPRFSTIGFVLMVGYYSGILATNLTHDMLPEEVYGVYIGLALLTLTTFGRHPELLSRLLGHKVPEKI